MTLSKVQQQFQTSARFIVNKKGMCALLEIIPPQTTAFAINAAQKRPTVVTDENGNDKIEIRLILPITIAIDHRALDYGDVVPL